MFNIIKERYLLFKKKYVVQQRRQYEYAINRYYAHLIDPFFTKLVYDLRLSPNAVTIINGLIGLGAGWSFLTRNWVLGALLLQLHHFLDGADGNLARLTNRCTPIGAKLDQISDQVVRYVLFICLAFSIEEAVWVKIALPLTMFLDVWIVQLFVLPFIRKHGLRRARWKQWFLDRGIIPGVDIFTVFFILSISAFLGRVEESIFVIIFLKIIDLSYRVWECIKTSIWNTRHKPKLDSEFGTTME